MSEKRIITPQEVKEKTPERFWSRIKFGEINECWIWQRGKHTMGYGHFMHEINGKIGVRATRFLYHSLHGDFDLSLGVLHECDNPPCCNPNHLILGTHKDNMDQMAERGRRKILFGSKNGFAKLNESDVIIIKKRLFNGEPQYKIASDYGVSQAVIKNINIGKSWKHVTGQTNILGKKTIRNVARGSRSHNAVLTEYQALEIRKYLATGITQKEIARIFGVRQNVISRINTGLTWNHVVSDAKRSLRKGNQKLTEDQVRVIKMRLINGDDYLSIAKDFKVCKDAIALIKRGKTWNHVNIN